MPDPRLSTVEENDFTDIETTADAWHLPPSYFSIPTSPTSITSPTSPILGRPPSSPYDCHFHSPLATSFAEDPNGKKIPSIEGNLKCDSPCNEGIACRFHNPEHPFHHRQKSSVPRGVWTPIVDVKEILAAEGEKKCKLSLRLLALVYQLHFSGFMISISSTMHTTYIPLQIPESSAPPATNRMSNHNP